MKNILLLCLLMIYRPLYAQKRVYTVAGNDTASTIGDGRPATKAQVSVTEGIWLDGNCNFYLSHADRKIRRVDNATGIITTIAGTGAKGFSGDGGPATDAKLSVYGLCSDIKGNVFFSDPNNNRVRKIEATSGIITTIAGGGATLGDGGPATNAQLSEPVNAYIDIDDNLYIAEKARIRKVSKSGIIATLAGTGIIGLSGDGGVATAAQIFSPHGMLCDDRGNFFFADRGNSRIRRIDSKGIITTYAGSSDGYSGDGGPATAAQLSGPISFVMDYSGGMVIGDNQNDVMRRVDPATGIITHFAGVGTTPMGSFADGALATEAEIHPEFMYLDRSGNIYIYHVFVIKYEK